jgi:hypothetical protein
MSTSQQVKEEEDLTQRSQRRAVLRTAEESVLSPDCVSTMLFLIFMMKRSMKEA